MWVPGPFPEAVLAGNPGSGKEEPLWDTQAPSLAPRLRTPPAFPEYRRPDTPRGQGPGPPEPAGAPHPAPSPSPLRVSCAQASPPCGPGCSLVAALVPSWCPHPMHPHGHLEAPPSPPGLSQTLCLGAPPSRPVWGPLLGGLCPGVQPPLGASCVHSTAVSWCRGAPLGAWLVTHCCSPHRAQGWAPWASGHKLNRCVSPVIMASPRGGSSGPELSRVCRPPPILKRAWSFLWPPVHCRGARTKPLSQAASSLCCRWQWDPWDRGHTLAGRLGDSGHPPPSRPCSCLFWGPVWFPEGPRQAPPKLLLHH